MCTGISDMKLPTNYFLEYHYELQSKSLNQIMNNSLTSFLKGQRMITYLQLYTNILKTELPLRFYNSTSILMYI